MSILILALSAFVVFAIAAVAVGRFTFGSLHESRQAVFDLDEATEWVAERLPFELRARMTHDDVRSLLGWYLDELEQTGVAYERDIERRVDEETVLVREDDIAAHVLGHAEAQDLDVSDVDVLLVIDETISYLRAIGAVGPAARPEPRQGM